jgi:hypothetical protein
MLLQNTTQQQLAAPILNCTDMGINGAHAL